MKVVFKPFGYILLIVIVYSFLTGCANAIFLCALLLCFFWGRCSFLITNVGFLSNPHRDQAWRLQPEVPRWPRRICPILLLPKLSRYRMCYLCFKPFLYYISEVFCLSVPDLFFFRLNLKCRVHLLFTLHFNVNVSLP